MDPVRKWRGEVSDPIKITAVKPMAGGFRVTVSVLEEPLQISPALYADHRLTEGIVLTQAQLDQLLRAIEVERCDRETARLLALREHTVGEIRQKLRRKGFGSAVIAGVVGKYQSKGLLDDARAAHYMVRQALERKAAGRSYLIALLRHKLVARELAAEVVDQALEGRDETALALAALERKWPSLAQLEVETAQRKAYSYLSRRGFGYEAARAAVQRLTGHTDEVSDD